MFDVLARGYMIFQVSSDKRIWEGGTYVGDELHFSVIMGMTLLVNYITTIMKCPLLRVMLAHWSRSLSFFFCLLHCLSFSFSVH